MECGAEVEVKEIAKEGWMATTPTQVGFEALELEVHEVHFGNVEWDGPTPTPTVTPTPTLTSTPTPTPELGEEENGDDQEVVERPKVLGAAAPSQVPAAGTETKATVLLALTGLIGAVIKVALFLF